jgi:tetratricopeptide (TPR) repeat protein
MDRIALFIALLLVSSALCCAGSEAEETYEKAKQAFLAGDYAQARDLAENASATAPGNPDIFLLLGKAHYQLGNLGAAVAAWKRTLSLAPEEPYASGMIKALRAEQASVDVRITLLRAMVDEYLFAQTVRECTVLLRDKALSGKQRATIMTLKANALVRTRHYEEARKLLQELLVLHVSDIVKLDVELLLALARLHSDKALKSEGFRALERIAENNPGTAAAATARYELIMFALKVNPASETVGKLAEWLERNPGHFMSSAALTTVVPSLLALTEQTLMPAASGPLSDFDKRALSLLEGWYRQFPEKDPGNVLATKCLDHLRDYYLKNDAARAAEEGAVKRLSIPLNRETRRRALQFLAGTKAASARAYLDRETRTGRLPPAA